jgi:hypothetical protein
MHTTLAEDLRDWPDESDGCRGPGIRDGESESQTAHCRQDYERSDKLKQQKDLPKYHAAGCIGIQCAQILNCDVPKNLYK